MTEKRFRYYEHKGADYILDTPNESLDFIEMLGDCLEAEEVVNLLNVLNEENEQLKKDLIDHSALISMLEDYKALKIEDMLFNMTGAKSEEEFNELYKPYLEKAKVMWND